MTHLYGVHHILHAAFPGDGADVLGRGKAGTADGLAAVLLAACPDLDGTSEPQTWPPLRIAAGGMKRDLTAPDRLSLADAVRREHEPISVW
jgi:hypothetical protein